MANVFGLFGVSVINWLNKQMNDQMISQHRLGPFEMHTKGGLPRKPLINPQDKV